MKRASKKKKKSSLEENSTNDIIQLEPLDNNVENEIIVEHTTTSEKKKSKKKSNKNKQIKLKESNSETIIKVSDDLLEVHEPGYIVKSRSKEDISTLNKNLKEGTPEGKLG